MSETDESHPVHGNLKLALEAIVQQRLEPTNQRIPCPCHIVLLSDVLIFAHPQILAQRES